MIARASWAGAVLLACGTPVAPREETPAPIAAAKTEPAAPAPTPTPTPQPAPVAVPPPGLVDLQAAIPTLRLSIGYATAANFTGAPLPGYEVAAAWAHPALADALVEVDRALANDGLGLLVYDAYRPRRATDAMVAWTRANDRGDLLRDGYIAAKSQHSRGLAIDLTLVDRETGAPLDMGGVWDAFERSSAAFAAKGDALAHRRKLRERMTRQAFVPHDGEWWHFSLPHPTAPVLDVPYGMP